MKYIVVGYRLLEFSDSIFVEVYNHYVSKNADILYCIEEYTILSFQSQQASYI
jgi:hypothetical protein